MFDGACSTLVPCLEQVDEPAAVQPSAVSEACEEQQGSDWDLGFDEDLERLLGEDAQDGGLPTNKWG